MEMTPRTPDLISIDFNKKINDLIARIMARAVNPIDRANIERLRNRISLVRQTSGGQQILLLCGPFIYEYADVITTSQKSCEDHFLNMDFNSTYGKYINKSSDGFAMSLIDMVKNHYRAAGAAERREIYADLCILLAWWSEYCIVTGADAAAKWGTI